mgnify:CR=1 FL=1
MLPVDFLRNNWRLLAFGWTMMLCSSLGQTYFVSIFGGQIRAEFGLSHAAYGTCYSLGTLVSAGILMWAGRLIDRHSLVLYSVTVLIALAVAAAAITLVGGVIGLTIVFFALRFFGQGLTTHGAMTAMGRYFSAERGRAVSFAALGHVTGQAVLPLVTVAALTVLPWRTVWLIGSGALLGLAVPIVVVLLRQVSAAKPGEAPRATTVAPMPGAEPSRDATLGHVLRDVRFYLWLPALLAPAYISTGLIFHQVHIASAKGWGLTLVASALSAFAVGSFIMMLCTGVLVDRYSARRLVPFGMVPLGAACLVLSLSEASAAPFAFFGLLGVGSGMEAVIVGAIWAEVYGVTHLGAIRAFATAMVVFASGLAPVAVGVMIDTQWSVGAIAMSCAIYCGVASILAALASRFPMDTTTRP